MTLKSTSAQPAWLWALVVAIVVALLPLGGCSDPFKEAAKRDTADAWRAYLSSGHGEEKERQHARQRQDDLLWEEAKELDCIASYRRYLEASPNGRHIRLAMTRLEELRFEQATDRTDARALQEFLVNYPAGRRSSTVRALLVRLRFEEVLDTGTLDGYEAFLQEFPDTTEARQVSEALERILLTTDDASGSLFALYTHRRRFPDSALKDEIESRALTLKVRARVLAGEEDEARAMVSRIGDEDLREQLHGVFEKARVHAALVRLDGDVLSSLAKELASDESRELASEASSALHSHPRRVELIHAARRLVETDMGLHESLVEAWRTDQDARRRRVAVRALGYSASPGAMESLRAALLDRNLGVRIEAMAALKRLGRSLDEEVRDVYLTEVMDSLEGATASPDRLFVVAVLLEASGYSERAIEAYRLAAVHEDQILAKLRLASLEKDEHRRSVALRGAGSWLVSALNLRREAVESSWRPAAPGEEILHDAALLRQLPPLLDSLGMALELASSSNVQSHELEWVEDAADLLPRMRRFFLDAEARAVFEDPAFIRYHVDEGAGRREAAEQQRVESVLDLGRHGVGFALAPWPLATARRSPYEREAEAATKILHAWEADR